MLGNDTAIGLMGYYRLYPENFRAELGYMLLPEYHSQGIMQEALLGMVKYGFEKMKLHTIEAVIDPRNMASKKVLEKTGFVKEAHFKENIFFEGKFLDSVHYTLFGNQ
jgi:ribosomal-protein-alanine N-acetyltransferase